MTKNHHSVAFIPVTSSGAFCHVSINIRSKRPRDVLNEIKWRGYPMHECTIYYLHRGAPNDTRIVRGFEITSLGNSFFTLENSSSIPYHRIQRIEYGGEVVYRKGQGQGGDGSA